MSVFAQSSNGEQRFAPFRVNDKSTQQKFQRYSSCDDACGSSRYSPGQQNSYNFKILTNNKINFNFNASNQEKQRAQSHKKLTLTQSNPMGLGSTQSQSINEKNAPLFSLSTAKHAYEGFKKQLAHKNALGTTLEKKGKYASLRNSQMIKFADRSDSDTQIRFSNPQNAQKQNTRPNVLHKQRSAAFIEALNSNKTEDSQKVEVEVNSTAPNSPMLEEIQMSNQTQRQSEQRLSIINQLENQKQFFHRQLNEYKSRQERIQMESDFRIKQFQSKLAENARLIQIKDQQINRMEQQISKSPSTDLRYVCSKIEDAYRKMRVLTEVIKGKHDSLNRKLQDLKQLLTDHAHYKLNRLGSRIESINETVNSKISSLERRVQRVLECSHQEIGALNEFSGTLRQRLSAFSHRPTTNITEVSHSQSTVFSQTMKSTINTTVESQKNGARQTKESIHSAQQNFDDSVTFWNQLEDPSFRNEETSFADDSFFYPEKFGNATSSDISIGNNFEMKSFPSFCKTSLEESQCVMKVKESCKDHEKNDWQWKSSSTVMSTLKEIYQYRSCTPVQVFIDSDGHLRHKSSDSYIFDRKGNILKPAKEEIDRCLQKEWICMN